MNLAGLSINLSYFEFLLKTENSILSLSTPSSTCLVTLEGLDRENPHLRELFISAKRGCGHVLHVLHALDVRPSNNECFSKFGFLIFEIIFFLFIYSSFRMLKESLG